ncbi:hypothetical protein D3C74_446910 [compost metagenome]
MNGFFTWVFHRGISPDIQYHFDFLRRNDLNFRKLCLWFIYNSFNQLDEVIGHSFNRASLVQAIGICEAENQTFRAFHGRKCQIEFCHILFAWAQSNL